MNGNDKAGDWDICSNCEAQNVPNETIVLRVSKLKS